MRTEELPKLDPELEMMIRKHLHRGKKDPFSKEGSLTPYFPKPQKTRPKRDWSEYQRIRENQKLNFYIILNSVMDFIEFPKAKRKNGRPSADIKNIIKSLCIKLYHDISSWGLKSELELAKVQGVVDIVYKKATINKYMASPEITPWLHKIYKTVASPLADLEFYWGIDASGFSGPNRDRWINVRLERKLQKGFQKLHVISGTSTMIIADARVTEGNRHDSPMLRPMLKEMNKVFQVRELTADAAYPSRENCDAVEKAGGIPIFDLKKNFKSTNRRGDGAWGRMIWSSRKHPEWWSERYHRRSLVEVIFSMMKSNFASYVRSKLSGARENEILCMVVCHNILVLSSMMITAGVQLSFQEVVA